MFELLSEYPNIERKPESNYMQAEGTSGHLWCNPDSWETHLGWGILHPRILAGLPRKSVRAVPALPEYFSALELTISLLCY